MAKVRSAREKIGRAGLYAAVQQEPEGSLGFRGVTAFLHSIGYGPALPMTVRESAVTAGALTLYWNCGLAADRNLAVPQTSLVSSGAILAVSSALQSYRNLGQRRACAPLFKTSLIRTERGNPPPPLRKYSCPLLRWGRHSRICLQYGRGVSRGRP